MSKLYNQSKKRNSDCFIRMFFFQHNSIYIYGGKYMYINE